MPQLPLRCLLFVTALLLPLTAAAQGTRADYERAAGLRARYQSLALNLVESPTWLDGTTRFWYRKSVSTGHEFITVDASTLQRQPSFDHARLAAVLGKEL